MDDEFVVARNPDTESSLPFLVRLPVGRRVLVLKVRDTWPRTAKVYCHPLATGWPDGVEILEQVRVRACVRRGAAIDLVLARARENRSQFVFTRARGRPVIFWQSARTTKLARPSVDLPRARAAGRRGDLEILVDTRERYPWRFAAQQATTRRAALAVGDYAVEHDDGTVVAAVERKTLADLVATIGGAGLRSTLSALAALPRAALVVEDRWSSVFKLERVKPAWIATAMAEAQVRFPGVPVVFGETRPLAQEWTYRCFGATLRFHDEEIGATHRADELPWITA